NVGVEAFFLGIGHKHHAIHAAEDQLTAGVVKDLARNGIQVKARAEAAHSPQVEWQEVKKQGPVSLRGQGDHLAFLFVCRFVENMLQVRGLTAQTGAVIDDLAVDFTSGKINKAQGSPSISPHNHGEVAGMGRNIKRLKNIFLYITTK